MAQILRPRHADPRAPQARAQVPHRIALLHPPHRRANGAHAPLGPPPALPTARPTQRSADPRLPLLQKLALADGLRPTPQGRARGLDARPRALGQRRDGPRRAGSASRARGRRGAHIPPPRMALMYLFTRRRRSFPSRRTCPRRPKSPHGRRTSRATPASRLCTRCGMPCSTSCARSRIRLPPLLLPTPYRHRRFQRPRQRPRPLLPVRVRAQA